MDPPYTFKKSLPAQAFLIFWTAVCKNLFAPKYF